MLLEETNFGTCGPQINGFILANKILREGQFWITMEADYIKYVQKCHQCQAYADMILGPPNELNMMSSPLPFSTWGMNVIGPIEPATSSRHRFILVDIYYLTKQVEFASYKVVTNEVNECFIQDCIVYRFGVPKLIIIDNDANLNSYMLKSMSETFKIKYRNSTRKMVNNYKQ